jgi:ATP-dependent RNA helicase DeaD
MVLFEVNLGAKDGAQANWILPLVCKRGAITRREVGAIRIARDRTFVEVARRAADEFAANASERDPRAPNVKIERATGPLPERSFSAPTPHRGAPRKTEHRGAPARKPDASGGHRAPQKRGPRH